MENDNNGYKVITVPTVNLNGTSKSRLIEEVESAVGSIRKAIAAVEDMTVNGRDYQTVGQDIFSKARSEHTDRIKKLHDVMDELTTYWEGIIDQ